MTGNMQKENRIAPTLHDKPAVESATSLRKTNTILSALITRTLLTPRSCMVIHAHLWVHYSTYVFKKKENKQPKNLIFWIKWIICLKLLLRLQTVCFGSKLLGILERSTSNCTLITLIMQGGPYQILPFQERKCSLEKYKWQPLKFKYYMEMKY